MIGTNEADSSSYIKLSDQYPLVLPISVYNLRAEKLKRSDPKREAALRVQPHGFTQRILRGVPDARMFGDCLLDFKSIANALLDFQYIGKRHTIE